MRTAEHSAAWCVLELDLEVLGGADSTCGAEDKAPPGSTCMVKSVELRENNKMQEEDRGGRRG